MSNPPAPEPDFFKVDEAARRLCAYDQGQDVDPEVWANDTPQTEREGYRREVYRYALVAEIMNTPQAGPPNVQTLKSRAPAKMFFMQPLALAIINHGYLVCRTCLWAPKHLMSKPKAKKLMAVHDKECPGEIPETRTPLEIRKAQFTLHGL